MKSKRKLLLISSMIILSLFLLTACKAETPPPAASESPVKAAIVEEQPTAPVATVPTEAKPEEPPKTTEVTPKIIEEPSKETNNDKSSLQIEGAGIKKAISLSLDELKAMTDAYYEDDYFSLNSYGTKEYFSFKGIRLDAVLERAGMQENATALTFIASDGYEFEITLEQALKEDYIDEQNPDKRYPVIIAWHENGQDYDAAKGAPFRLVIGQIKPGDVNKPQWVQNIAKIIVN